MTGIGQPRDVSPSRISRAFASAASCSASVLEIFAFRTASQSMSNQRLLTMSESAVVDSDSAGQSRLQALASRSGDTGLTVTYAPA